MRSHLLSVGVLVCAACAAGPPAAPGAWAAEASGGGDASVERLLGQVRSRYEAAGSYLDQGSATYVFGGARPSTHRLRFTTGFSRPRYFAFSSSEGEAGARAVIWTTGDRYRIWRASSPRVEEYAVISDAVAEAGGGASRIGRFVAKLLIPSLPGDPPLRLFRDAVLLSEEPVGGRTCQVLERRTSRGVDTLWVGKDSGLVVRTRSRRVLERRFRGVAAEDAELLELGGGAAEDALPVEVTTDYEPRVDVPVPLERFAFEPPDAGAP